MSSPILILSYVIRDIVRSRTLLVLILSGLSVASAAILLTMGILGGFRTMLAEGEQGWLADIVISPDGDDRSIGNSGEITQALSILPQVEAFSVRSQGQTIVRYDDRETNPFRIIGIDVGSTEATTWLPSKIIGGEFFSEHSTHPDEAVLGKTLADSLVGGSDDGELIPIGEDIFVLGSSGEFKRYRVRGIVDAKTLYSNWILYLTKAEFEKLDSEGRNAQIIVKLRPWVDIGVVRQLLDDRFPGVNVRTWDEESSYVKGIMQVVEFITRSIHLLLILSVFMVISIVIYINVSQKRRQIGILKSMGAENRFIFSAYLIESYLYAAASFLIGLGIFFLIHRASVAYPVPLPIGDFRVEFALTTVVSSWVTILAATILGGMAPAIMAARMKIADVMRGTV